MLALAPLTATCLDIQLGMAEPKAKGGVDGLNSSYRLRITSPAKEGVSSKPL
jgi:hypothetical protein